MIKGVIHAHLGPILCQSEPSDVPYSPDQFLGWYFFAASYSKTSQCLLMLNIYFSNVTSGLPCYTWCCWLLTLGIYNSNALFFELVVKESTANENDPKSILPLNRNSYFTSWWISLMQNVTKYGRPTVYNCGSSANLHQTVQSQLWTFIACWKESSQRL